MIQQSDDPKHPMFVVVYQHKESGVELASCLMRAKNKKAALEWANDKTERLINPEPASGPATWSADDIVVAVEDVRTHMDVLVKNAITLEANDGSEA